MAQTLEENLLGEKLMAYGGINHDGPIYFIYTPSGTTRQSFLMEVGNRKSFPEFVQYIQNALSEKDIDKVYQNSCQARTIGKELGILGIEECTRYAMHDSLAEYLKSENPDLNKVKDYCNQFGIKFRE